MTRNHPFSSAAFSLRTKTISKQAFHVVMDIGGTNIRIGTLADGRVVDIMTWPCREFTGPEQAVAQYRDSTVRDIKTLCLAIAAPIRGDTVSMVNLDWTFSIKMLQQNLQLQTLHVINDFAAMCLAVPGLTPQEEYQIGTGTADPGKPVLVCGPGTGLGVGLLCRFEGKWQALPGEGGHMDFAPNTEYETDLWRGLHHKYGHVSAERLLSGPGLEELYQIICTLRSAPAAALSAAEISAQAIAGEDEICAQVLQLFCAMLGSFCGSLALVTGAFGGVYITGGMVPKFLDFFLQSEFRSRFEAKGRYRKYNEDIPTFVVTAEYPGLRGAAQYLLQHQ